MEEQLIDQVEKMEKLFDYISNKTDYDEAQKLLDKLGFDNPHILMKFSLDKCKELADKFLRFREIAKGNE